MFNKKMNLFIIITAVVMTFAGGCEPAGENSMDENSVCADMELIAGDWYDFDHQLMTVTLTELEETCKVEFQGPGAYLTGIFEGIDLPLIREVFAKDQKVDCIFGIILVQTAYC